MGQKVPGPPWEMQLPPPQKKIQIAQPPENIPPKNYQPP